MKKLLLLVILFGCGFLSRGQTLISNNFDGYNGLVPTIAPGWYYSWNDTASASKSFYNSTGTCGVSCPTYKFGHDTVTIITPAFSTADSVRFYLKGNGTFHPENHFSMLESVDSLIWVQTFDMDSISASANIYTIPVNPLTTHLQFVYHKDSLGYNVGIDDISVFRGTFIGISEVAKSGVSIYPNPSNGPVTVEVNGITLHNVSISVTNILGREMNRFSYSELHGHNTFDLSALDEGIYMVRLKSDKADILQRVLIKK